MSPTEPGWYPDPEQSGQDRWWDGDKYTAETRVSEAGATPPPTPQPQGDAQPGWASQPTSVFEPSSTPGSGPPASGAPYGSAPPYDAGPAGGSSFGPSSGPYGAPPGPGFQQPSYGAPGPAPGFGTGGFTPPPPPPPAKKSVAPWVVITIVAVVAICCFGGVALVAMTPDNGTTTDTTVAAPSTTVRPTTTTTPGKTETLAAGYSFTHPGWQQDADSNGFKVWNVKAEGTDPVGGKLAVKDPSVPPNNMDSACAGLPSGKVESFPLGTKTEKFCKYVKDDKYVQWEGYGKHQSTNYVVLVRYPGTAVDSIPTMPDNVKKTLATFSNS